MKRLFYLTSFALLLWPRAAFGSSEPLTYNINAKKWSHILDDHFISITVNPTDLLQGKAFGLGMNSTVEILKGLSPAYIRFGSADTGKYTFKRSRYPSDVARTEDEFIVTESHWTILNDVARSAGLDIIVCLNAAHRDGGNRKWDTRNSLELISFSDSQGYNLTFQLGYEVHRSSGISGHQYGKDLNRLRTILNAFPRYQNSKLVGPDIRVLHRKDEVEFVNEVLGEAGAILNAVTWHPRWPQPSKMKVSDISELGYEFPSDYIEWDKAQLTRVLQKALYKNPIWIGEPKTESTGTFAEGLLWARRLLLSAKLGIEVVMKQPTLMDISHPKPEYWIAFLHKRLLGKAVLETRAVSNQTEVSVITHCTNPLFWAGRRSKVIDGAMTVYAVNMGGKEQKVVVKGTWTGKSQIMLQYVLTSGSDPDSVFSQVTYLNGEPLMMTDEGHLPDIMPKVKRIDRGVVVKLPPYSVGFWVVPEARVKICQSQPLTVSPVNFETLSSASMLRTTQRSIAGNHNLNQLIVDKLKNPVSEVRSDEVSSEEVEEADDDDDVGESEEETRRRSSRRVRQVTIEDIGQELKDKIREIRDMIESRGTASVLNRPPLYPSDVLRAAEEKITSLTDDLGTTTRLTDQNEELERFLHRAGLNQDFGELMMNGRRNDALRRSINPRLRWASVPRATPASVFTPPLDVKLRRFRRSLLSYPEDDYEEESSESYTSSEEAAPDSSAEGRPPRKTNHRKRFYRPREDSDEISDHTGFTGPRALKGLEETYKTFLKRKPADPRLLLKKNDPDDDGRKTKKTNVLGNDLQEEILMKEVEVLQKTEEAMANLIKNHKKRQQSLQEIILHEISDIKEDRLSALEEVRHQKEAEEEEREKEDLAKIPRAVLEMLQKNVEPNPIVKRSIEYTTLNSLPEHPAKLRIIKRSANSPDERTKRKWRRTGRNRHTDDDDDETSRERGSRRLRKSRSERLERMKNFIQSRERLRDRNIFMRKQQKAHRKHKADLSEEDNSNEVVSMHEQDYISKNGDAIVKEIARELFMKPERKTEDNVEEQRINHSGKKEEKKQENVHDSFKIHSNNTVRNGEHDSNGRQNVGSTTTTPKPKTNEKETKNGDDFSHAPKTAVAKKTKAEDAAEYVPLKVDKNRSLNVLKKISNLIETINSREKAREKTKKTSTDVEDLSDEFYSDTIAKLTKRRHRRSHHKDGDDSEDVEDNAEEEQVEQEEGQELSRADAKALRKEMLLRRRLERLKRRRKITEEASEGEGSLGSRLKMRKMEKLARRTSTEAAVTEAATDVQSEAPNTPTEEVKEGMMHVGAAKAEEMENMTSPQDVNVEEMKKESKEKVREEEKIEAKASTEAADVTKEATQPALEKVELAVTETAETTTEDKSGTAVEGNVKEEAVNEEIVGSPTTTPPATEGGDSSEKAKQPEMEESSVTTTPATVWRLQSTQDASTEEIPSGETSSSSASSSESYYRLLQPMPELGSYESSRSSEDIGPYDADAITELMEGYGLRPFRVMQVPRDPLEASWDEDEYPMYYARKRNSNSQAKDTSDATDEAKEFPTVLGSRIEKNSRKEKSKQEVDDRTVPEPGSYLPEVIQEETAEEVREPVLKRQRRGIFDTRRGSSTPEERIRDFMRMSRSSGSGSSRHYRRGNEVPMVADGQNFWKVAGSTVKAVFNDVIPEAYGKTKIKIENLGIAEYFKEFGKIVEQMKNLDRLFANIGQAAVRNYIKGSEDEKGDYIQVIEKKRRSRRNVEDVMENNTKESEGSAEEEPSIKFIPTTTTTTTTEPPILRRKPGDVPPRTAATRYAGSKRNEIRPDDLLGEIFLMDSNPGIVEVTKKPPPAEEPAASPPPTLSPFQSRYAKLPKLDYFRANKFHPPLARQKNPRHATAVESLDSERDFQAPEMSKFAPWMKTTKDFINQALTTLQRQRELSEMIARESVNDLVKREMRRKVIGKREIPATSYFPVYQVPSNRKRETYDETAKYLTHLQPGVYIVPTEEMKNLRSEQIMKEAPSTKPGMPNMVTLNIYYDKKKQSEWSSPSTEEEVSEPVATDYTGYYQAPGITWNPVPGANHQEVMPPPVRDAYLPQFQPEQDIFHYQNQYADWTPPLPKSYPRNRHSYYATAQAKSDWADFGVRHSQFPDNADHGWVVQTQPPKRKASRLREPIRPVRTFPDKKRSVDKGDSAFSGLALPFWKFFAPPRDEKDVAAVETAAAQPDKAIDPETEHDSEESESFEEMFAENRKRARMNEAKQKKSEEEDEEETDARDEQHSDVEANSRRKRDLRDDLIPEWFGTVQDLDNSLRENGGEQSRDYNEDVLLVDVPRREKRSLELAASVQTKPKVEGSGRNDGAPLLKRADGEDSSLEVPTAEIFSSTRAPSTPEYHHQMGANDALTQFFRYAYDSLISMMKGMTDFIN